MKYKVETESVVDPVVTEIQEESTSEKSKLETALTDFLAKVVECKHSYITCDKMHECLREVGASIVFALNVYWPNWVFPEIPAANKGSFETEDIVTALENLMKIADKTATLASEENNWLVVKKMQHSLGKLGESINVLRKKND